MTCPAWSRDNIRDPVLIAAVRIAYQRMALSVSSKIITSTDPLDWHRIIFAGFVPLDYYAGNYRQADPRRVCLGVDVNVDGIPGSSYRMVILEIGSLFDELGRELASQEARWTTLTPQDRALFVATWIATLVGHFVRIHPFINGNGRISRFVWSWGLLRVGLPIQCRIIDRPGPPYGDLMKAAMERDFAPLTLYILRAMAGASPGPTLPLGGSIAI